MFCPQVVTIVDQLILPDDKVRIRALPICTSIPGRVKRNAECMCWNGLGRAGAKPKVLESLKVSAPMLTYLS